MMDFLLNLLEFNLRVPFEQIFVIVGLYLFILWISFAIWVWLNSKQYSESTVLRVFFLISTVIFGPGGVFLYLLLRNYIAEESTQQDMYLEGVSLCKECGRPSFQDDVYCPWCGGHKLVRCKNCKSDNILGIDNCVKCGTALIEKFPFENKKKKFGFKLKIPTFPRFKIPSIRLKKFFYKKKGSQIKKKEKKHARKKTKNKQ